MRLSSFVSLSQICVGEGKTGHEATTIVHTCLQLLSPNQCVSFKELRKCVLSAF